tara:strand:+ start:1769 stop:2809 length:1041 start_codon:yes stop_codon:yes gene_type:complete
MKLAIITDQHFGARKSSKLFHDYFKKFYDNIFFPYLKEHNINTVIDMGDTFDNRRAIDLWSIDWAKNNYFNVLDSMGVKLHTIVGNHTAYYKDTNQVNTINLLLNEYKNISIYPEAEEITIDKLKVLLLPWINSENKEKTFDLIKKSNAKVAMGHLELNGFVATRGHMMEDGMDIDILSKFDKVYSGHYHTRSTDGKIYYLGNPYELYWNDVNDSRGFHIFDTETLEHTPIDNPYRIFYNVYYEDTPHQLFDASEYNNKIVKVIVRQKTSQRKFEKFLDKLYSVGVSELKVIENFVIQDNDDFEVEESENTLSILNRYIDDSEIDCDKSIVKGILQKVYREACEVE